jgi:hypothetical protein
VDQPGERLGCRNSLLHRNKRVAAYRLAGEFDLTAEGLCYNLVLLL